MGLKVIGLDIADQALDEAKSSGADHVFNSMTEKDWQKKIVEITGGGVDAAVNFTASKKSYDDAPAIIRPGGLHEIGLCTSTRWSPGTWQLLLMFH